MKSQSHLMKWLFGRRQVLCAAITLVLTLAAMSVAAFAHEPETIKATVTNLPRTGDASQIRCQLQITNPNNLPVWVDLPASRSPLGYVITAAPGRVALNSRQQTVVSLHINIAADGKYQVLIPLIVRDRRGMLLSETKAALYLEVHRGRYTQSSYRALFVNPEAIERDNTGQSFQMYRVGPPPAGWRDSPEFNEPNSDVEELERMKRSTVFETDWRESPTLPLPPPKLVGKPSKHSPDESDSDAAALSERLLKNSPQSLTSSAITAKGTLKYTGADGLLHPCYGWQVYAYWLYEGSKIPIAHGNVKPNGNWELSINIPAPSIKIEYQPRNRFFTFADSADNTFYSFSSQVIYHPQPGDVLNEFTQVAYLANDSLVNLGELFSDGMKLWRALHKDGGGISPLRDESIAIYFPNTTQTCGLDRAWSCANPNGYIWILAEHGANRNVMIHELSHQVNYEYWDNDIPGNGGAHSLPDCVDDPGDALMEGFADFMVAWVRLPRSLLSQYPDATLQEYNVESPPNDTCTQKNLNELWVAATFWDIHDQRIDGDDAFFFIQSGAAVAIYLINGRHDSMGEYQAIYKAYITHPQNLAKIDAIFAQNHQ